MENRYKRFIGEIISEKRNELKLTQKEVADRTGLSRSYVADLEAGRYCPSIRNIARIAGVLKIDLNLIVPLAALSGGEKDG